MNIIYHECKLLGITKRGFNFLSGCRDVGGGGRRCPLLPPLLYSNDRGGQFYSNEEQFPFLPLICNQML
jgi:hypothetical protein